MLGAGKFSLLPSIVFAIGRSKAVVLLVCVFAASFDCSLRGILHLFVSASCCVLVRPILQCDYLNGEKSFVSRLFVTCVQFCGIFFFFFFFFFFTLPLDVIVRLYSVIVMLLSHLLCYVSRKNLLA